MADNLDLSKDEINKSFQGSNIPLEQDQFNANSVIPRPSYSSVWKRPSSEEINSQINPSAGQKLSDKRSSFASRMVKSFSLSKTSINEDTQKSSSSTNTVNKFIQRSISEIEPRQAAVIEQNRNLQWEAETGSAKHWNQGQSEDGNSTTEHASAYGHGEYYTYEEPYKKKSISKKIDRFVQRIPALGKLYKQPSTSSDQYGSQQDFHPQQTSDLSDYKPTPDDLALNERYSDKTRMQSISLQAKDQTQLVDICIHSGTNKIYLCDLGRSVVEIYDSNRTLQHVMDNPTMIKFHPTAVTVAFDGTVIVASHFNHCLHMYLPVNSSIEATCYSYKQFKLGVEGNQIHQFYQPAGIFMDNTDGYLYVCDRGNCRIQVFRPEGLCERIIELFLNTKKKYQLDPVRVALQKSLDQLVCIIGTGDAICFIPKQSSGRIYVDPLYVFDENELGLENASGIATDAQDRIFISDTGHHRIVVCTSDGSYLTSFGSLGDEPGQLNRPCGLDITKDGTVIVTDPGNKRVQLFGLINEQPPVENSSSDEKSTNNNDLSVDKDSNIVLAL